MTPSTPTGNPKPSVAPATSVRGQVKIPARQALSMASGYARSRLGAQAKAVAFIVVYLLAVQLFLFKAPILNALGVAGGIAATVAGLAFFLEGLLLAIMPLGERCGLRLPAKAGPLAIALFALVIGVTATFAEPAIVVLKAQGGGLQPWDSPLLYYLLGPGSGTLVWAVATGVGLAVVLGVFRFMYGWSFKPFVLVLIPPLVAASFFFENDPGLRGILGLAWDTGGVTTGPVTVPMVIALGTGVARLRGAGSGGASGLGVVTLASALPVAAVMAVAAVLAPAFPQPGNAAEFFGPDARVAAERAVGGAGALKEAAVRALEAGVLSPDLAAQAFPEGLKVGAVGNRASGGGALAAGAWAAVKAVVPLALVLVVTLVVLLRERLRGADEIALGLVFAVLGLFLFNLGMEHGLSALGAQSGSALPRAYQETSREDRAVTVRGVDTDDIFSAAGADGPREFVWITDGKTAQAVPLDRSRLDPDAGVYRHVPVESAVFAALGRWAGLAAVLAFAFALGFGATLAEPSLAALGLTVEELTTGTYRRSSLVRTVAVGVGLGMAAGFARILFDLPLSAVLAVPYALALVLTLLSSEDFSAIAWDSAGVTTGPVTVPLVIATGLGLGSNPAASFGVLAAASAFPVVAVLASGILSEARARRSLGMDTLAGGLAR
ncbi:MAG: DUF1538 family protein [Spirochaetia bacterium]|nr:DUF1538 family protein [Spirochaetia bacterium]